MRARRGQPPLTAVDESLLGALLARECAPGLRALDQRGELTRLIPELEAGRGFAQPELHHYDVFEHNVAAVEALDRVLRPGKANSMLRAALPWIDLDAKLGTITSGMPLIALTRLACLLHDVAKPDTATMVEGRLRFPRHGPRGAELMRERLPAAGFDGAAVEVVARLIRYHLRPRELILSWPVSDRAVRRFVADLDGQVLPLLLVNLCDGMATRGPAYTDENYVRHCAFISYVAGRAWAADGAGTVTPPPLVTGDELITELDLESGRLLGAVLTSIRHAQFEGVISDRDSALALARSVLASLRVDDR